jgi:hypothetical protein
VRLLLIGSLLIGLCLAPVARAQDKPSPEAMDAARELLAIMSPDLVKQLTAAFLEPLFKSVETQYAGRIGRDALKEILDEFQKIGARFVGDAVMDAPVIYARHFSASELREMIAFYRTPTGAKALQIMPNLAGEVLAMLMPRMAGLQQELEAAATAVLRKRGLGGR